MEAVCLTCLVRYEFGEELLQQGTPVLCPTCQVSLMLVHPGTNTPLDQPLDPVVVQQTQPQEHSPPETGTETSPPDMTAATSPLTGQTNPSDPGQATAAPAFEAPGWEDIAKPLESLPAEPALDEQSSAFKPAISSPPKEAPSASPIEDWSAAAARWAANGFSADAMPEFVKQPAQPNFSPVQPAAQINQFLPAEPSPLLDIPKADFPQPVIEPVTDPSSLAPPMPTSSPVAQSEPFTPTPPPLPVQAAPAPDSVPPWASAGNEAEPTGQFGKASTDPLITPVAVNIEEADAAVETQAEEVADEPVRSSHIALWLVLVLILAGAGGAAVWYFFPQEDTVDIDSASKENVEVANSALPKKSPSQNKGRQATQAKTIESAKAKSTESDNRPDKLAKQGSNTESTNTSEAGLEEYKKGNNFIREGKFKEAVNEFKKALSLNPKLTQAHRGLGISFAQLRQNQQACQEYRLYRNTLPADSKEVPALEGILKDCR